MTFTNITKGGIYLQCCHREVEPGGTFTVPWLRGRTDRGLRAAMASGVLAWESGKDEPEVPGSPRLRTPEERAKLAYWKKRAADAKREAEEKALREKMRADDEGVKANMARMGRFDLPKPVPRRAPERAAARERPVTRADIIVDRKPASLADVVRHNRAVQALGADADPDGKAGTGKAGKAVRTGRTGRTGVVIIDKSKEV